MAVNAPTSLRRSTAVLAAVVLVAAVATGCGSSSSSTATTGTSTQAAAAFVRDVTTQFARGQSGRLWDSLHPADQAAVSRARYMACETNEGFTLQSIKVLDTYKDTIDIGGKPTSSTAVSLQVTSDDGVTTATMHAVPVNGTWRWILPAGELRTYKLGNCPKT